MATTARAATIRVLTSLYGAIALLHGVGWTLYLAYSQRYPAIVGLGLVAYLFGLRHAFDADHIAAIDDTVRYMRQLGRRPFAAGFFFSLGHSTVVFGLAVAIACATAALKQGLPQLQSLGAVLGTGISGLFLWIIGALNLTVLVDLLKAWRETRAGGHDHAHLEELLAQRGLLHRLLGGRLRRLMASSWQLYPLGLLFGLGFDTASEIGLLAMTAGASAGNLPLPAVLSLPILFSAGMTLMDTTDGVLMCKAYDWAFLNPVRKIFYNVTATGLSVAVALVIGTVELLQVLGNVLDLRGPVFAAAARIDFAGMGYVIVGLFLLAWAGSVAAWRRGRASSR